MIDPINAEIESLLHNPADPAQPQAQPPGPSIADQPVELVRGPDGVIAAVKVGGRVLALVRGQDGRISGFQPLTPPAPQPQGPAPEMPPPGLIPGA